MIDLLLKYRLWTLPLLAMALITPFTPWFDQHTAQYFYDHGSGHEQFVSHPLFDFLYVWALVPGQLMAALALFVFCLSYLFKKIKPWRPHSLYLILTLAVGSGLISHALLKDHWGRPRPRQVIQYGGQQEYRPIWKPNFTQQPEPSKSFPCGHCTMGFYFFCLYFIGKRLNKQWLKRVGLALAISIGISLGITRMAQGGHFFSDICMSALIMWLTAYAFDRLIYEEFA